MSRQRKIKQLPKLFESLLADSADVFVLFVDLCGSTDFKQNCTRQGLPESTWIFRQLIFLERAAEFVQKYKGITIKTVGDSLIAIFEATTAPEEVIKCAVEIIQGFENFKPYEGKAKILAKVSMDFGFTYNGSISGKVQYDPIGTPVDRCSRLNDIAKPNEIVLSDEFVSAFPSPAMIDQIRQKYGLTTRHEELKGLGQTTFHVFIAS